MGRCCQTCAFVSITLVGAALLMRAARFQDSQVSAAPVQRQFLPAPELERVQGVIDVRPLQPRQQHGQVQVVDDVDDSHSWHWQGSSRYAPSTASVCYYDYEGFAADCFCKLANNKVCRSKSCACSQGCSSSLTWRHKSSTTFKNIKYATGCQKEDSTALLTVPESFFADIRHLKTWCPQGAQKLLAEMFRASFQTFREVVGEGPARQCMHAAQLVSVPWLHLHTLCADGHIDGLPGSPTMGWCGTMHSSHDAEPLAASAMLWAERLYGVRSQSLPSSCSEMGCGIAGIGGRCSCKSDCQVHTNCCDDFSSICRP
ncbi:unnamed protein product [Effrenium voratum]|nr:unnamed protein product [Effrenium voratum]